LRARQVFQAKYGRGDALVALFQEINTRMQEEGGNAPHFRILTDATGPFFTVVTEIEVASFCRLGGRVQRRDEPSVDGGVVQPDDAASRVRTSRVLQHHRIAALLTGL
jgi:hypothetical protein